MVLNSNYRNNIVAKDNKLIQGRYDLSMIEQKLILIMCSYIEPDDDDFNMVTFKVIDLAKIMGVSEKNLYRDLPKITESLLSKVVKINVEVDGKERLIQTHFVSTVIYNKGAGTIDFKFSEEIKPYLIQLKTLFTSYRLSNILNLNSKYGIRLYEIFKAHAFKGKVLLEIEEMKNILCLTQDSYNDYNRFKKKVVNSAIEEINKNTDIEVTFEEEKESRKVVALEFSIKEKKKNIDGNGETPLKNQFNIEDVINQSGINLSLNNIDSTVTRYNPAVTKLIKELGEVKIKISPRTLNGHYETYGEEIFKRASNIFISKAREEKIKKPGGYLTGILENLAKEKSKEPTNQENPLKHKNFTQRHEEDSNYLSDMELDFKRAMGIIE